MKSDGELVKEAKEGSTKAFESLVWRYARLVWSTVAGMSSGSWTEDAVQEVFLNAWKGIHNLESPESFRPWLITTARRIVFRFQEKYGRPTESPAGEPGDDSSKDNGTMRLHVQSAIQRLPERYQLPLLLRFLGEMSREEISRSLGLSNGALRGLLQRGTRMLRVELAPYWKGKMEE